MSTSSGVITVQRTVLEKKRYNEARVEFWSCSNLSSGQHLPLAYLMTI